MASIDNLPNEILEKILVLSTVWINRSLQLSTVCRRWNHVMKRRLSLVKFLLRGYYIMALDEDQIEEIIDSEPQVSFLLLSRNPIEPQVLAKYLNFMPNVRILDITWPTDGSEVHSLIELVNSKSTIEGLNWNASASVNQIWPKLKNTKSLSINSIEYETPQETFQYFPENLTQFYDVTENLFPVEILTSFPEIRRLHMLHITDGFNESYSLANYEGPLLQNFEMFELCFCDPSFFYDLNYFLQYCPSLKSLFLKFDESLEAYYEYPSHYDHHEPLENLVIQAEKCWSNYRRWSHYDGMLRMFPNLKNLAIRYIPSLQEEQVTRSLQSLPKLEFLEIKLSERDCHRDSQCLLNSNAISSAYLQFHGRDLRCIIKKDHYKSFERRYPLIGESFDFMSQVFPKDFRDAPHFLVDKLHL